MNRRKFEHIPSGNFYLLGTKGNWLHPIGGEGDKVPLGLTVGAQDWREVSPEKKVVYVPEVLKLSNAPYKILSFKLDNSDSILTLRKNGMYLCGDYKGNQEGLYTDEQLLNGMMSDYIPYRYLTYTIYSVQRSDGMTLTVGGPCSTYSGGYIIKSFELKKGQMIVHLRNADNSKLDSWYARVLLKNAGKHYENHVINGQ